MIVSDAPNCGITYDCHYDDRNSFIIQATAYYGPVSSTQKKSFMFLTPGRGFRRHGTGERRARDTRATRRWTCVCRGLGVGEVRCSRRLQGFASPSKNIDALVSGGSIVGRAPHNLDQNSEMIIKREFLSPKLRLGNIDINSPSDDRFWRLAAKCSDTFVSS